MNKLFRVYAMLTLHLVCSSTHEMTPFGAQSAFLSLTEDAREVAGEVALPR